MKAGRKFGISILVLAFVFALFDLFMIFIMRGYPETLIAPVPVLFSMALAFIIFPGKSTGTLKQTSLNFIWKQSSKTNHVFWIIFILLGTISGLGLIYFLDQFKQ